MSERFVWERSNVSAQKTAGTGTSVYAVTVNCLEEDVFWDTERSGAYYEIINGPVYFIYGSGYTIANGGLQITGAGVTTISNGTRSSNGRFNLTVVPGAEHEGGPVSVDWYIGISKSRVSTQAFSHIYRLRGTISWNYGTGINYIEGLCLYGSSTTQLCIRDNAGSSDVTSISNSGIYSISKGPSNGTVSNAAASTYPPQNYASKSARMCP